MPILTIPPSLPYQGQYVAFGNDGNCPAVEAPRSAPFYIDWSSVSAQSPTIAIDYTNASNMPSQVSGLYVDNGRSHQGVYVLFPDTSFRLAVPPFTRGFYPVLTKARRFYVGIFSPAAGSSDHTVIHALNWAPQPIEGDALLLPVIGTVQFDPAASVAGGALIANPAAAWLRLREFNIQFGGMTAGVAGFIAYFQLLADGAVVARAAMHLAASEFVDANSLLELRNQDAAAISWTYSWTVTAGAATTDGTASGNINIYADAAEQN